MSGYLSLRSLFVIVDIALVAYIVYRVLLIVRGTRAVQMLVGLSSIIGLFFTAKFFQLQTLEWVLGTFLNSIILVVIVIFQEEIRRALTKAGIRPIFFGSQNKIYNDAVVDDLVYAVSSLARDRTGALIVIQREVGIEEFLEDATIIDAPLNRKVLISLFQKTGPLHDGALIIENDRIKAAGCFLPLSFDPELDPALGTRHRAALGLSERSDAVILVVSEETSSISMVQDAEIKRAIDPLQLKDVLLAALSKKAEVKEEVAV